MPTVAYQWHQGMGDNMNLDLTAAVASLNVGDVYDGLNASYEARLNYNTSFLGDDLAKPGSLYAGGYHAWLAGNTRTALPALTATGRTGAVVGGGNLLNQDSLNGFYAGWNQEWWRGIGTFVNYHWANNSDTNYLFTTLNQGTGASQTRLNNATTFAIAPRQTLSGGLSIPMRIFGDGKRSKDVLGFAYAMLDFQEGGAGGEDALEHVAELYYKWQATDNIAIIPSAQLIFNRMGLGDNDAATVIGLRTSYSF
jgi:hypothetical protein